VEKQEKKRKEAAKKQKQKTKSLMSSMATFLIEKERSRQGLARRGEDPLISERIQGLREAVKRGMT